MTATGHTSVDWEAVGPELLEALQFARTMYLGLSNGQIKNLRQRAAEDADSEYSKIAVALQENQRGTLAQIDAALARATGREPT